MTLTLDEELAGRQVERQMAGNKYDQRKIVALEQIADGLLRLDFTLRDLAERYEIGQIVREYDLALGDMLPPQPEVVKEAPLDPPKSKPKKEKVKI